MATFKVGADGKAPEYARPGDIIVTGGGTYQVGADGKGVLFSKDVNTANFSGSYDTPHQNPVNAVTQPQAQLRGLSLADKYGLTYDVNAIKGILDNATRQKYTEQKQAYEQTENQFYKNISDTQATTLDTLRRAQAQAVATGASRGIAAANEISTMLGMQQTSTDAANELAVAGDQLGAKEAAEIAANSATALETSNAVKQAIGNLDSTLYGYDTQGSIGYLDYLAAMSNVGAQKYAADKSLEATKYSSDSYQKNTSTSSNTTYGTSNTKYANATPAEIDKTVSDVKKGKNPSGDTMVKDSNGTDIRIHDNGDGTYSLFGISGKDLPNIDAATLAKLRRHAYNIDSIINYDYGSMTLPTVKTVSEAQSYYNKYGTAPAGWKYDAASKSWIPGNDGGSWAKDESNIIAGSTAHGRQIKVGSVVWTYDTKSDVWSAGQGHMGSTSMTPAEFQAYVNKQNPNTIRVIK